jgi:hypothetical protein
MGGRLGFLLPGRSSEITAACRDRRRDRLRGVSPVKKMALVPIVRPDFTGYALHARF